MGSGTEQALWLRGVLKAERERRGWSLSQAARAIGRETGKGLTKQSLKAWEDFEVQPKIDQFAAWARALGLRLEVDLVQREDSTVVARLPPEVAALGREIALLDNGDRQLVADFVRRLQRHV